jgi:hypothetical protein
VRPLSAKLPIEAWVSRHGLPLRIRAAHAADESVDMTVDLLEFGVPVNGQTPPDEKVIEEADFNRFIEGQDLDP